MNTAKYNLTQIAENKVDRLLTREEAIKLLIADDVEYIENNGAEDYLLAINMNGVKGYNQMSGEELTTELNERFEVVKTKVIDDGVKSILISIRVSAKEGSWRKVRNINKKLCDRCKALLWISPSGGIYCNASHS